MPADRSRAEFHVDWELPPAKTPKTISFAPNVTPGTFECPPLVDAPLESALFPSEPLYSAPPATSRRSTHGKKRPLDHIPRPPNAFILFRTSFIKNQHVPGNIEGNHSTLSKIIGLCWQNLPYEERQVWQSKAKVALDEHKRKYPDYSFKPAPKDGGQGGGTAPPKRKVRESERADQLRCEKIADLLVRGKKGEDLHEAVKEFDRLRVAPAVQPRFEAPITACNYRRSSSAPAPDSPEARLQVKDSKPKGRPSKRPRAVSSRPSPARDCDASSSSTLKCETPIQNIITFPKSESVIPSPMSLEFAQFSFENASSESLVVPELQSSPPGQMYGLSRSSSYESLPPLTPSNSFESLPTLSTGGFPATCETGSWSELYSAPVSPLSYSAPSPNDFIPSPPTFDFNISSIPPPAAPVAVDHRRPSAILAEQIEQWTRENPNASLFDLIEQPAPTPTHEFVDLNLELYAQGLSSYNFTLDQTPIHPQVQTPIMGC